MERGGRKGVSGGIEEEMNAAPVPSFCLKQGLDKQEVQLHSLVPVTLGPFFAPSLSPGTSLLGRTKKQLNFPRALFTQLPLQPVRATPGNS